MKRKIIIDCDPGIDDSLALMLALSSDDIEVLGITIVSGNTPVQMGFENAKKVLKHMQRLDIPIYIGAAVPLMKEYVNALDTHGKDGLGESFLPEVDGYQQDKDAVSFLIETLKKEHCSIIALGPLTNIAQVIMKDPTAFACIDKLISMGGNFRSHGNCSPVAEYNYWEDPDSAALVFQYLAKIQKQIHMIGLDVTRKIVLTPNLLSYIERLHSYHGAFIKQITKFYFEFHWEWEHIIGCIINDPLAMAFYIQPQICTGFAAYVEIVTDGAARGQSIVDEYGFYKKKANAYVYHQVDTFAFYHLFFERLFQCSKAEIAYLDKLIVKE